MTRTHSIRVWLAALTVLIGAMPARAADKVNIEVGMFSAPEEAVPWLQQEIIGFQAAYPDVEVTVREVNGGIRQQFQKHSDYFGSNPENMLAANVTGIDGQWASVAPFLAEEGLIEPIEKFDQSNDGFELSDFYPNMLELVKYRGKTWGVPWLSWDTVVVADMDLLQKSGIGAPPRTWDEFLQSAKILTRDTNGDGAIDQWGLGYRRSDDGTPYLFLSLILQQGGRLMHDGKFDSSDPSIEASMRFMNNFVSAWNVAKADPRSLDERLADPNVHYAMHLEPNHTLGDAANNPKFRIVPLPSFDGRPRNFGAHRLYFAVRKSTPAQEQASWEFVKWMTRTDISLPPVMAGFPVRKSFTNRADFRDFAQGKIQNAELIFNAGQYGEANVDSVVDVAPASERYWQIIVPAFDRPNTIPLALSRAQDSANAYLGDWYRK